MDRKKLDTLIEGEAHKLVVNVAQHAESYVQLFARRKGLNVDEKLLDVLTEVMKQAMEEGFQTQVDFFSKGISKALDAYTAEENPFPRTSTGRKTAAK